MKKVAAINDLSGFGKCSLTAAIPVLSALGVQCCPIASAVLTNQTGYPHYSCVDLSDMLPQYMEAWKSNNAHFDGIYSGYMMNSQAIEQFMEFVREFYEKDTFLLVDPVMGDDGRKYSIFSEELLSSMKCLAAKADLITPNLTEGCLLADYSLEKAYSDKTKEHLLTVAREVATKLRNSAEKEQDVVITGIKCMDESVPAIINLTLDGTGFGEYSMPFVDRSFSGTGDLFASVVCGCRVRGMSTQKAIKLASTFIYHGIEDTVADNTPGNDGINFENHLIELIKGVNNYDK